MVLLDWLNWSHIGNFLGLVGINYAIIHKHTGKRLKADLDSKKLVLTDDSIQPDHLWKLEESKDHNGYYYITNMVVPNAKVARYTDGVIYYEGARVDDQLWKFVQNGEKYEYQIVNLEYSNHKLVPNAEEKLTTYGGAFYNDQLWELAKEMDYPCWFLW